MRTQAKWLIGFLMVALSACVGPTPEPEALRPVWSLTPDLLIQGANAQATLEAGTAMAALINTQIALANAQNTSVAAQLTATPVGLMVPAIFVALRLVRDKAPVQRFSAGATSGVRRLLEMVNTERLYSLGELDVRLRASQLDVRDALPVWEREVMGAIERQWGRAWRRFTAVLVVGGGALLLRDSLVQRFNGKAIVPEEPVLSIARGLYKLGLYQSRAKRA